MLETVWQDIQYGIRALLKNRSFAVVAILTLALGIGANTAIFSVVNSVLLSPLSYPESDRLVMVWTAVPSKNIPRMAVCVRDYEDWRERNTVFEEVAVFQSQNGSLIGGEMPERVRYALVTPGLFQALMSTPALGRAFQEEENLQGQDKVVILSHGFWQSHFGGDQGVIDRSVLLNEERLTIVGVMPAEFSFPDQRTQLWKPFGRNGDQMGGRANYSVGSIARLKPSVTVEQAQADLDSIMAGLAEQFPINKGIGAKVDDLREIAVGSIRTTLLILWGTVGLVLLVACGNVANLLLGRVPQRQKEIAIRASLGARSARIVRQLLTESLALSLMGGLVGLLLAWGGIQLMLSYGAASVPQIQEVEIDARVLGFSLGLAVATGLIFGLLPAFRGAGVQLADSLKEGGRQGSRAASPWMRSVLVGFQMMASLILLVCAGLLVRSFASVLQEEPGFEVQGLLTMRIEPPVQTQYPGRDQEEAYRRDKAVEREQMNRFYEELLGSIRQVPGVRSATMVDLKPLSGRGSRMRMLIRGRPQVASNQLPVALVRVVGPDYFQAAGIPLLSGRYPSEADHGSAPQVFLISETLARLHFPGEDPLGQKISTRDRNTWATVVGVVGDVRFGLEHDPAPTIYAPFAQSHQFGHFRDWGMDLIVRAEGNPLDLAGRVRELVQSQVKTLPVFAIASMEGTLSDAVAGRRFNMILMGGFAVLALVLASVGIYGVLSFMVSQRTHEIGVRVTLGASRASILGMIVGRGMILTAVGLVAGLVAASFLTVYLESWLFKVEPNDPITLAAVSFLLALVALVACYVPARRATRIDPILALRNE